MLKFENIFEDRFIYSGLGSEVKVNGNLIIEFETKLADSSENLVIYINKSDIDFAANVLEVMYDSIEEKSPNLLPKIDSTYKDSVVHFFQITATEKNLEKPNCRICKNKKRNIIYAFTCR